MEILSFKMLDGLKQTSTKWVLRPFSPGVKLPGRQADNSPQTSAEVEYGGFIRLLSPYIFRVRCLIKASINFTFTSTFISSHISLLSLRNEITEKHQMENDSNQMYLCEYYESCLTSN
jgi:hypothetical protein